MFKFSILFMIHIAISITYLLLFYKIYPEQKIYRSIIIFLIPIFGALFFLLTDILEKLERNPMTYNREELMAKRAKKQFLVKPDYNQYVNLVPLEEAFILSDPYEKRKLLLDILKKNMDGYIRQVKLALGDNDSETSHYAASTIMELTRKHMLLLQSMEVEYEKNEEDIDFSLEYGENLKKYADSGILEEKDRKKYLYQYIKVIEKIIYEVENNLKEDIYINLIEALMEVESYNNIEKYCMEYKKEYPLSEQAYIYLLKYYYATGQTLSFFKILKDLKETTIPISKNTLSLIRFWEEDYSEC